MFCRVLGKRETRSAQKSQNNSRSNKTGSNVNSNSNKENLNKKREESEKIIPSKIVKNKFAKNYESNKTIENNNNNINNINTNNNDYNINNYINNKDQFSLRRQDSIGNRKLHERKLLNIKNKSLHNIGNLVNKIDKGEKLETEGNLKMPKLSVNMTKENYPVLNTENNDSYKKRKNIILDSDPYNQNEEDFISPQFKKIEFRKGKFFI